MNKKKIDWSKPLRATDASDLRDRMVYIGPLNYKDGHVLLYEEVNGRPLVKVTEEGRQLTHAVNGPVIVENIPEETKEYRPRWKSAAGQYRVTAHMGNLAAKNKIQTREASYLAPPLELSWIEEYTYTNCKLTNVKIIEQKEYPCESSAS